MPAPQTTPKTLHLPDLHGAARLLVDATIGITGIVEAMHHTIASRVNPLGAAPPGRTTGLTGLIYRTISGTAQLTGAAIDAAWEYLVPDVSLATPTPKREAILAALNGVCGDHLTATSNKLAIPMRLRIDGRALDLSPAALHTEFPAASPRIIVLVHGLCLNDLQWRRENHDHGLSLAQDLGATAIYLHYNTGRHVSENGAEFAALLNTLVTNWPVPVESLAIIGHSMGGLVTRAACLHGGAFLPYLNHLIFLGTPHHGAPLERGGLVIDKLLGVSPYLAPFARLGKARSAGITDLRFGNIAEPDCLGRNRHNQHHDNRRPTPLPAGVQTCLVAATLGEEKTSLKSHYLGDGLVPLASALGQHENAVLTLNIPPAQTYIAHQANHFDLLSRADIYAHLKQWLAP